MSIDEKKKTFVIKHTFTDVNNLGSNMRHYGKTDNHFSLPWSIYICPFAGASNAYLKLELLHFNWHDEWSIGMTTETRIFVDEGDIAIYVKKHVLSQNKTRTEELMGSSLLLEDYLVDGNLTVECHVTIHKMTGIEKSILINFNDNSAKDASDVVLLVDGQKFHVSKLYLAYHSTYFKSLFLGNFEESKQSEVELKDIEPDDFQKFLEALYGEPVINEDNIEGILQLADMYDAKTVIRQCEQFLLHRPQRDSKFKFDMALKYNMDQLKNKCISELKSVEDLEKVIPEDDTYIDKSTFRQLLNMSIEFYKKK